MSFLKKESETYIVLVTAPDLSTARSLARSALKQRLAACVNLIPKIESHYWWEDKLDRSEETLMVIKTARNRLQGLHDLILSEHPYDTPEYLCIPVSSGNRGYLKWIRASVLGPDA